MDGKRPARIENDIGGGTFYGPVLQAGTVNASFPEAAGPTQYAQLHCWDGGNRDRAAVEGPRLLYISNAGEEVYSNIRYAEISAILYMPDGSQKLFHDDKTIMQILNELGDQGWEVLTIETRNDAFEDSGAPRPDRRFWLRRRRPGTDPG
jgi:hypothetical protein